MASDRNMLSDAELERVFERIADGAPTPSPALMARVLADAEALRPVPGARAAGGGWFAAVLEALGGWKGAGGLVTAGVVGLWIGINPPAAVETTTAALWDALAPDLLTAGLSGADGLL